MSQGSEAAEQMTREAVKLSEEAVKLSALGAKNLAALCLAMAKDNQKLKGKTKLKRLLTEGKELRVFDLKEEDVSVFAKEAKTYGILFSTIRNTKSDRDTVDVIVKAEDAARINRIFENMGYAVPERAKKEMSRTQQENKSSGLGTGLAKADMRSERESVVGKIKTYQKLLQNQKKRKDVGYFFPRPSPIPYSKFRFLIILLSIRSTGKQPYKIRTVSFIF